VRQNFRVARQTPNANFSNFQITPNAKIGQKRRQNVMTHSPDSNPSISSNGIL